MKTERLAATTAYLCGINITRWAYASLDSQSLFEELDSQSDIKTVHILSKLRTILMKNITAIDDFRSYALDSYDSMMWFDANDFRFLEINGITLNLRPKAASDMVAEVNDALFSRIDEVIQKLYPLWIHTEFIKNLFLFPKKGGKYSVSEERVKYSKNYGRYPFLAYINWNPSDNEPYLFKDDITLLTVLYRKNGLEFEQEDKCQDASVQIKNNVYDFLESASRTVIVVDCENANPFKLYSFLTSDGISSKLSKIEKIILYDDVNTTKQWANLQNVTQIPIERIETRRILKHKSVVDATLISGICKCFYKDNIDSFLLFSSDSDYLAMIFSIPDGSFFVLTEEEKVSDCVKTELDAANIPHCSLDEFGAGDYEAFSQKLLLTEFKREFPTLIGKNAMEVVKDIYTTVGLTDADEEDMAAFYKRFAKHLVLTINDNGCYEIVLP